MTTHPAKFWGILLVLSVASCCGPVRQKDQAVNQGPDSISPQQVPAPRAPTAVNLPPGQARIIGTVLEIEAAQAGSRPEDPCARAPCFATIRIDAVQGYGAAFPRPLSVGETIPVKFAFTLRPTERLIPDLSRHYPGLSVGSAFTADLQARTEPDPATGGRTVFTIYGYEKR